MKIAWLNRHNPHDHKLQPDRVLQQVRIASPCSADWERMSGDQRIRHCPECNLNVYNLSAMTAREAAQLVANREGRLCVHFYRRTDGTMLTQNCPRGLRVTIKRVSRIAGAAFSAVIGMTIMTLRATPLQGSSRLVQIDRNNSGIAVQVADPTGAVIVNAHVTVVNESTKSEITGATGSSGTLRLLHLAAGSYVIAVSSPGFRPYSEVVAARAAGDKPKHHPAGGSDHRRSR
jgi:hypothetical protein